MTCTFLARASHMLTRWILVALLLGSSQGAAYADQSAGLKGRIIMTDRGAVIVGVMQVERFNIASKDFNIASSEEAGAGDNVSRTNIVIHSDTSTGYNVSGLLEIDRTGRWLMGPGTQIVLEKRPTSILGYLAHTDNVSFRITKQGPEILNDGGELYSSYGDLSTTWKGVAGEDGKVRTRATLHVRAPGFGERDVDRMLGEATGTEKDVLYLQTTVYTKSILVGLRQYTFEDAPPYRKQVYGSHLPSKGIYSFQPDEETPRQKVSDNGKSLGDIGRGPPNKARKPSSTKAVESVYLHGRILDEKKLPIRWSSISLEESPRRGSYCINVGEGAVMESPRITASSDSDGTFLARVDLSKTDLGKSYTLTANNPLGRVMKERAARIVQDSDGNPVFIRFDGKLAAMNNLGDLYVPTAKTGAVAP
jgi:hypothetical protein